jgi:hypothetical protein
MSSEKKDEDEGRILKGESAASLVAGKPTGYCVTRRSRSTFEALDELDASR